MKKIVIIMLIVAATLMMISCTRTGQANDETVNTQDSQSNNVSAETDNNDAASFPDLEADDEDESSDVWNLPEELYLYKNYDSANKSLLMSPKICTFDVEEETTLKIKSEINIGSLSLTIKADGSDEAVYETEELKNNEDSVTLQPGTYKLTLKGKLSNGYLHITKV